MIRIKTRGDWSKTTKFLDKASNGKNIDRILEKYGKEGVAALSVATPKLTGKTASSWRYSVERTSQGATISWYNDNVNKGVNIALILQYGHGTRNGGYVEGRDYINPAIQPVFDKIADSAWKEVTG